MNNTLRPIPDGEDRKRIARMIREQSAVLAETRPETPQRANGEADDALALAQAAPDDWIPAHGTFTKGLTHDEFGRVRGRDLIALADALNQEQDDPNKPGLVPFPGVVDGPHAGRAARYDVPYFDGAHSRPAQPATGSRRHESPLSGHVYDLEGADPDAVGIPPAPGLGSDELIAEMAEVYGAAILRDVPFELWPERAAAVAEAIAKLPFFAKPPKGAAGRRRAARGDISAETLFVGSTPGSKVGPYISQFMLIGSAERSSLPPGAPESAALDSGAAVDLPVAAAAFASPTLCDAHGITRPVEPCHGFIRYGVQSIDQRFIGHLEGFDHMTEWAVWRDVQNGAKRRNAFDRYQPAARFAATPRDLATYVHFDELEQAYRNAVLLMLGAGQPTDRGLPEGGDHPTRDGFATFGGPHVLALISEVASRALKAVRRQKFNIHLRGRPEAVAAGIALAWTGGKAAESLGLQRAGFERMCQQLTDVGLLQMVRDTNAARNADWDALYEGGTDLGPLTGQTNALLPMAFPEGSPMHPAYGAGHATVAGACVTIAKAFFEMYDLPDTVPSRGQMNVYDAIGQGGAPATFQPDLFAAERLITAADGPLAPATYRPLGPDYQSLEACSGPALTVQGELDKLAANISIGRNFAGVHFFTDYYESIRLGERVAVALLQEQLLTYREPVSMRFTSFDGDRIMLAGTGGSRCEQDAQVLVWDETGKGGTEATTTDWWLRHR